MVLPEPDRFREEDPFTDRWVGIAANQIVVDVSRFEFDLNRPREAAVYRQPEDAWGLELWASPLDETVANRSLEQYDRFYSDLELVCDDLAARHRRFVVIDLHSYNHRRGGADARVDDPAKNPEVNIGTGSIDRERWGALIDGFMAAVSEAPFDGGHLDVRENVRFHGGEMSKWVNRRYGDRGMALAVEIKKIYMDEWTGVEDEAAIVDVGAALQAGADVVREMLD